jgi:hypothetical protein
MINFLVKQKVQSFAMISISILLCEFFEVSKYNEINCNLIFGFLYNVFLNADSSYMK